jgi:predicted esterase
LLAAGGVAVTYDESDGGHQIEAARAQKASAWLAATLMPQAGPADDGH